jgi:hypothetical protein
MSLILSAVEVTAIREALYAVLQSGRVQATVDAAWREVPVLDLHEL